MEESNKEEKIEQSAEFNADTPKSPYQTRLRNKFHRRQAALLSCLRDYISFADEFLNQKGTRKKSVLQKELKAAKKLFNLLPKKITREEELRSMIISFNNLFNLPNNEDEINKMIEEIREKEKKENEDKV